MTATGSPPTLDSRIARGCMLKASEVADVLGIAERTLWRLVQQGKFPKPDVRLSRKLVRWNSAPLLAWLGRGAGGEP